VLARSKSARGYSVRNYSLRSQKVAAARLHRKGQIRSGGQKLQVISYRREVAGQKLQVRKCRSAEVQKRRSAEAAKSRKEQKNNKTTE
jgi:hypothetical protein